MSLLLATGFEGEASQVDGKWTMNQSIGGCSYDAGIPDSGSYAFFQNGTAIGAGGWSFPTWPIAGGTTNQWHWVHARFFFDSLLAGNQDIMALGQQAGGAYGAGVYLYTDGRMKIWQRGGAALGSFSSVIPIQQWFTITLGAIINTGANTMNAELYLDGVLQSTASWTLGVATAFAATWLMPFGTPGTGRFTYLDNVIVVNENGTDPQIRPDYQTKLVTLWPVSDNNRGTWTGGSGATTNLSAALGNTPPVGTATETDISQIENAQNTASAPGDFNMQSYTGAGLALSDVVQFARLYLEHGEDSATATKTGTCTIVSNPAQGGTTGFTFGDDAGALATYPTNWRHHDSTLLYLPTVTLGTSPVARVTKTTSSTAVGSVCQMGIVVGYAPGVTPSPGARQRSIMHVA